MPSSSDLPVQTPLLSDMDQRDRDQQYVIEDEAHDHRMEDALLNEGRLRPSPARAYFIRSLALLCACSLSIGSH